MDLGSSTLEVNLGSGILDQVIQKSCVAKTLEGPAAFLDIQEGRSESQATSFKQQAGLTIELNRFI